MLHTKCIVGVELDYPARLTHQTRRFLRAYPPVTQHIAPQHVAPQTKPLQSVPAGRMGDPRV